jgi:hypothetical protein
MTEKLQPGDKVRAVFEGVVTDRSDNFIELDHGRRYIHEADRVEVLERADDPAHDPIGTVRRKGNRTFARLGESQEYPWKNITDGLSRSGARTTIMGNWHESMIGTEIIGVVPGTPAAEAQEEQPEPPSAPANAWPVVVHAGVKGTSGIEITRGRDDTFGDIVHLAMIAGGDVGKHLWFTKQSAGKIAEAITG